MGRLETKTVLVTGGGSGIGKGIVQRMTEEGARVVIADKDSEAGTAAASEYGAVFMKHDICDETGWSRVIDDVESSFGKLDVLVNNAAIFGGLASFPDTTLDERRRIFAINVDGVFLGCRAALPALKKGGGGSIVNIASVAGMIATPHRAGYGASKAAVRQLTKSVAQFCAQEKMNVRCNSIHPGNVRTPLWEREAEAAAKTLGVSVDDYVANREKLAPLGGFTRAQDVAAAAAYLASEDARHITGTALIVDGADVRV